MTANDLAKTLISNEYMGFLNDIENNYYDKARVHFENMKRMNEQYRASRNISYLFYLRFKKIIKEYDVMYACKDIRKKDENCNRHSYIVSRHHFYD